MFQANMVEEARAALDNIIHSTFASFNVLQGEKALKDETSEPRNVLKDRLKVENYASKLQAYAAANRLSKSFVLLQPDETPDDKLPWDFFKVPCSSDSAIVSSCQTTKLPRTCRLKSR
jgi:hypothetical protein